MKRDVRKKEYTIRNITHYIISAYPHKDIYFTKYYFTKEYLPFYSKDK